MLILNPQASRALRGLIPFNNGMSWGPCPSRICPTPQHTCLSGGQDQLMCPEFTFLQPFILHPCLSHWWENLNYGSRPQPMSTTGWELSSQLSSMGSTPAPLSWILTPCPDTRCAFSWQPPCQPAKCVFYILSKLEWEPMRGFLSWKLLLEEE